MVVGGWLAESEGVGGWVDTWTDGRAGNKSCVSESEFPPVLHLLFSDTAWEEADSHRDGGQAKDAGGLWLSGSVTVHLLPKLCALLSPHLASREEPGLATSCDHREQTKEALLPRLTPKIASHHSDLAAWLTLPHSSLLKQIL